MFHDLGPWLDPTNDTQDGGTHSPENAPLKQKLPILAPFPYWHHDDSTQQSRSMSLKSPEISTAISKKSPQALTAPPRLTRLRYQGTPRYATGRIRPGKKKTVRTKPRRHAAIMVRCVWFI